MARSGVGLNRSCIVILAARPGWLVRTNVQVVRLGIPSALCDVGDSFQFGQGSQLVVLMYPTLYDMLCS